MYTQRKTMPKHSFVRAINRINYFWGFISPIKMTNQLRIITNIELMMITLTKTKKQDMLLSNLTIGPKKKMRDLLNI